MTLLLQQFLMPRISQEKIEKYKLCFKR